MGAANWVYGGSILVCLLIALMLGDK